MAGDLGTGLNRNNNLIPSDGVKQGSVGLGKQRYSFNTTNTDLIPTHDISIKGVHYCPYCGDIMFYVQEPRTYAVIGYCCLCEGARAEIEYETHKRALILENEQRLLSHQKEYADKLTFCSEKLFEIHQQMEQKHFRPEPRLNHFATLNGERYTSIE